MLKKWWHNTIGYQIYPKSFQDSNGDGIGDLKGIISRLDDLADLGINVIWLCPVNQSPMMDHGYDISDYDKIDPVFGSIEDMKELIREADLRQIKILMDLVVNHTSSEHPWFQKALADPSGEYGKYYIIKEGKNGKEPNNWRSIFGGSAWERIEGTDLYYLHLFTKWQPDLNWENPVLRKNIYEMINRWLDMGIGGFRVDAIGHLKKDFSYQDPEPDGVDGYANGFDYFTNAEGIDIFLNELKENTFKLYDAMTIGEVDEGVPPDSLSDFVGEDGYFSSIFDFCHNRFHINSTEWKDDPIKMIDVLKQLLFEKQNMIKGKGIFCNYLENHDTSRCAQRFIPENEIDFYSKSMTGGINFFMPGIVFLYQGQSIGMMDYQKEHIEDFKDPATFNKYHGLLDAGLSAEDALARINLESREHARTPMQWNNKKYAGFSESEPWFAVNPNYEQINFESQKNDPDSLYSFYKKMISLRKSKEFQELFIYGEITPLFEQETGILAYERKWNNKTVWIILNANPSDTALSLSETVKNILLSNYKEIRLNDHDLQMYRYHLLVLEMSQHFK